MKTKTIKDFFNWLAEPATRNYTLGEAYQHYVQNKPYSEINDNRFGYTNAGRMTERLHLFAGVASAALIIGSLPITAPITLLAAGGFIGLYKVWGLAAGKLADMAVAGRFYTPPKKQSNISLG